MQDMEIGEDVKEDENCELQYETRRKENSPVAEFIDTFRKLNPMTHTPL
jgi:hypothetical protein